MALKVAPGKNADGSVDVTVTTDKFALYITLTSLAQGYFSENTYVVSLSLCSCLKSSYAWSSYQRFSLRQQTSRHCLVNSLFVTGNLDLTPSVPPQHIHLRCKPSRHKCQVPSGWWGDQNDPVHSHNWVCDERPHFVNAGGARGYVHVIQTHVDVLADACCITFGTHNVVVGGDLTAFQFREAFAFRALALCCYLGMNAWHP